jgi:hypothetical protein
MGLLQRGETKEGSESKWKELLIRARTTQYDLLGPCRRRKLFAITVKMR